MTFFISFRRKLEGILKFFLKVVLKKNLVKIKFLNNLIVQPGYLKTINLILISSIFLFFLGVFNYFSINNIFFIEGYILFIITFFLFFSNYKGIFKFFFLLISLCSIFKILFNNFFFNNFFANSFNFFFNDNYLNYFISSNIFVDFIILFIFFLICYILLTYFLKKNINFDYIVIILFLFLGIIFLLKANHLMVFFLALEIISFSTYILIGIEAKNLYAVEASLKYFILSALSSAFFLLGLVIIYYSSGSLFFNDVTSYFLFNFDNLELSFLSYIFYINKCYTAYLLLILVLFFKLGLAPFHFWVPDVYEGSSIYTTALMMFVVKTGYFFGLLKILQNFSFFFQNYFYLNIYLFFCLTSIVVGSLLALNQKRIKRFIAYSSITNMGYILLMLPFDFVNSCNFFLFYIVFNIIFFCSFILVNNIYNLIYLTDFFKLNIKFFFIFFIFIFASIPPSPFFFFKFYLLFCLYLNSYFICFFVVLVTSLISLFYYLRIIQIICYKQVIFKEYNNRVNLKFNLFLGLMPLFLTLIYLFFF